jgi:predicted ArsR family transcriptional regulator
MNTVPQYPATPGHKAPGVSADAATAIAPKAMRLRGLCLALLAEGPMTADEAAEKLGELPFSIRPRFSELLALGLIADTGLRRPSSGGSPMTVWRPCEARGSIK